MKPALRRQLEERRLAEIVEAAARSKRVLARLLSATFDTEALVAWRAVEATGVAAASIAEGDPDYVREHLRRLFWLLSEESGGICWRAPETMAEIVHQCPVLFADYIPIVAHLLLEMAEEDLSHFRAGILWAIGRLGELAASVVPDVLPAVLDALHRPDPQVRGMAVWCLQQLGEHAELAARPQLAFDEGVVDLYEHGELHTIRVGQMISRARVKDRAQS